MSHRCSTDDSLNDDCLPEERYFRALIESSSEILCVLDDTAILRYANPGFFRLLGYSPEEALGRSAFDFIAEADRPRLIELFGELLTEPGKSIASDFAVHRQDGTARLLSALGRNLLHDPAVRGIVVNAHDLTERRRAESALRESEARFEHVAANIPGMVYQYAIQPDGSGAYTYVSEGARTLFGVRPDAVLRNPRVLLDLIPPDERAAFRDLALDAAAGLLPFRWEGRVVLPSGEERFVQVVACDERQPDGTVLSDGIVTDVTALHQAARRLAESEERFRSLFDHNPDAVFSFDLEGQFVSANPACEVVSGYPPGTLLGQSFEPLVCSDDLDTARAGFQAAAAGKANRYEVTIRHRSGRLVPILVTNVPIVVGGRVVGVFGIAKDLTVRRELEQQLRQAQKMEAVGRLAGGIAHDFNNLLTVIVSYTQMALKTLPPSSRVVADLREVAMAADRAAALTRQLLAFSRRQVLQPRQLDANRTVMEVVGMLRRIVGEDITLETRLASNLWSIHADPGQLVQVLMNLAVNARDAMPAGGTIRLRTANVTVMDGECSTCRGLVSGEYVSVVVEDTGTGIDPAVLPHIFEPFYTTKSLGEGTGLGLATVYGIVKQSGGYIYAESTAGEGSRFIVLLPRADLPVDGVVDTPASQPEGGTETILLVEDDAAVRGAVRRMLRSLGYPVLEADGTASALAVAAEADAQGTHIQLVLTDVVMPEHNGRALAERLAAFWPSVPVLYMSGYTDDEILRRGLMQPGAAFLEKPFTAERLAAAIRDVLGQHAGAATD